MRSGVFSKPRRNISCEAKHLLRLFMVMASITMSFMAGDALAGGKKVESGQTQVVAKVNGREITHNEVRVEMARLSLIPTDPNAERIAMQAIVDRTVAAEAARSAKIDRRPDALWRMEAAKEQALADLYMGLVAQPVEPTQSEIQDFMLANPTLFTEARRYSFSVLEIGLDDFDLDSMTPLFDERSDFKRLQDFLDKSQIAYSLSASVRPASSFPEAIRVQLAKYDVSDNIVLQGSDKISILKIIRIMNDSVTLEEGSPSARAILRREDATKKVTTRIEALRKTAKVTYYRDTVKPSAPEAREAKGQ